jgi:hypothetical protein
MHGVVGWANDLSAPLYDQLFDQRLLSIVGVRASGERNPVILLVGPTGAISGILSPY